MFTLQTVPAREEGPRKGVAEYAGFSLHAGIGVEADQRQKLERFTRYVSRPLELPDGHVIVIDRAVTFKESNSWAGDTYSATETRATLSFRDEFSETPAWNVPLIPLVLYRDTKPAEHIPLELRARLHSDGRIAAKYMSIQADVPGR